MTDIEHDELLPFAVVDKDSNQVYARFASEWDAEEYVEAGETLELVNTSPIQLPNGIGAVVAFSQTMPLVRVSVSYWVMPMQAGKPANGSGATHPVCQPLRGNRYYLTDDDVRSIIKQKQAANERVTMVPGREH